MKTQITNNLPRSSMFQRMGSYARSNISLVLIAIVCVGLVGTLSAQTNDPQSVLYVQGWQIEVTVSPGVIIRGLRS